MGKGYAANSGTRTLRVINHKLEKEDGWPRVRKERRGNGPVQVVTREKFEQQKQAVKAAETAGPGLEVVGLALAAPAPAPKKPVKKPADLRHGVSYAAVAKPAAPPAAAKAVKLPPLLDPKKPSYAAAANGLAADAAFPPLSGAAPARPAVGGGRADSGKRNYAVAAASPGKRGSLFKEGSTMEREMLPSLAVAATVSPPRGGR